MPRFLRVVLRRAPGMALALLLATALGFWSGQPVGAANACSTAADVRATTCRLLDGGAITGSLGESGSATYRLDTLAPDANVVLTLAAQGGSTTVSLLNWRGEAVAEGLRADDAPDVSVQAQLSLPGAYAVRVSGDLPPSAPEFRLTTTMTYPSPARQALWPAALATPDQELTGERQVVRTPRGGSPTAGLAVARALGAPPDGEVGDFTLVSDVQFERLVGASAFTVRFRYQPEAGGGSGYVLAVDPIAGTATLDSFDEGQRRSIASQVPLPLMPMSDAPNRLVLQAEGPSIRITLDGLPVLDVSDDRYPRGLIAVGAVTWSDPVAVLFDHIQVTIPSP